MGPATRRAAKRWTLACGIAVSLVGLVGIRSLRRGPIPAEGPSRFAADAQPGVTSAVSETSASPPRAAAGEDSASGAEEGAAASRPLTDPAVVFERSVGVRGLIRGLDERPASDMLVEWSRSQQGLEPLTAVTDPAGYYEMRGLEPGPYLVRVVPRLVGAAWEDAPRRQVTLREGAENRFDFTTDAGHELAVLVVDGEGRAAAGVQVRFELRTAARGISGFLPATGRDGRTLLGGLPRAGTLSLAGPAGGEALELDLDRLPAEARLAPR